jgi:cell division protein FtsL
MAQNKKSVIKKNNKKFARAVKILVFICALVIVLCGVGILLYSVGSFPDFNKHIDTTLMKIKENKSSDSVKSDEQKNMDSEVTPLATVFDQTVTFSGLLLGEMNFFTPEITSKTQETQNEWDTKFVKYISHYPSVTNVCKFSDCYIFLDAQPSLIRVNIQTGEVKRTPCPVYPGSNAIVKDSDYLFDGRDGRQYVFSFDPLNSDLDTMVDFNMFPNNLDINKKLLTYYIDKIAPDSKTTEVILDNLYNWAGFSKDNVLPKMNFIDPESIDTLFSLESNIKNVSVISPTLFVFSPTIQGIYKIGLCDKKGSWLKKRAYVAVFSNDELILVSLDYKSDEPQIQLQLSNRQLYYIVAGNFSDSITVAADSEGSIMQSSSNDEIKKDPLFLKIQEVD